MQCEVWSVECEDFASSLAEKIKRLSREGHGRDRLSLNYRSFMFGKLPPPACPGLCYFISCVLSSRLLPPAFFRVTPWSSFNLQRRFLWKNAKNM